MQKVKRKRREVVIREYALLSDRLKLAYEYNTLGVAERNLGNYMIAKQFFADSLAIRLKSLPSDHRDLKISLNNLGNLEMDTKDFLEAKKTLRNVSRHDFERNER